MASSDPQGEVPASTPNSPGALAGSPVERQTAQVNRRVSARAHTRQATAAHAAQDRSWRDPPGTTPSRGPKRVRRGASPAPLPRQGPAAGTMSPVLGRPPRASRSRPVTPEATALGVEEGTTATGKTTGAPRATGPDEARRTTAGSRGTPKRLATGHSHGTRTGAKQRQTRGAANPRSAHNIRRTAAWGRCQAKRAPTPEHRTHNQWTAGPSRTTEERADGRGTAPKPGRPTARQELPTPDIFVPPPQRAKPARKSARSGVCDGSPRPPPPHPQPVGGRPGSHARRTGGRAWDSA